MSMIWLILAIWFLSNALIFFALVKPLPPDIREVRRHPF